MEKNVKINLNGKTISANTSNVDETAYAFRIEDGCSLTINGNGVVNGGSGCANNIAVWTKENCKLVINDGKFIVGRDKDGESNSVIYIHNNGASVEINGGEFQGPVSLTHHNGHYYLVNINNNVTDADIKIKGGIFYGWNPEAGDDEIPESLMPLIAEGFESYIIDENGTDMEGRSCIIYGVRRK